jgi:hypothetical protein
LFITDQDMNEYSPITSKILVVGLLPIGSKATEFVFMPSLTINHRGRSKMKKLLVCAMLISLSITLCSQALATVKINEISPDSWSNDWIEIINIGESTINIEDWELRDSRDSNTYPFPEDTYLNPNEILVIEQSEFDFRLGRSDSVRLFDDTDSLIDSYSWTSYPDTTYGRCPDGTGAFIEMETITKGAPNDCNGSPTDPQPWTEDNVQTIDDSSTYLSNLSGLHIEPADGGEAAKLWAVQNRPSKIFLYEKKISGWSLTNSRDLRFPSGSGSPDAEGITKAEWDSPYLYVCTERDNDASGARLSILRYNETVSTPMTATHEWNLTSQLPSPSAYYGLEGITWIPDTYLESVNFYDEEEGDIYDPNNYPNHGTGLFVIGQEATGNLYVVALDHVTQNAVILATIETGHDRVMSLEFDRENNLLWAGCDNNCDNELTVLSIDIEPGSPTEGRFVVDMYIDPPDSLPNSNNEGIAFEWDDECSDDSKDFFWADDNDEDGYSIRSNGFKCYGMF